MTLRWIDKQIEQILKETNCKNIDEALQKIKALEKEMEEQNE